MAARSLISPLISEAVLHRTHEGQHPVTVLHLFDAEPAPAAVLSRNFGGNPFPRESSMPFSSRILLVVRAPASPPVRDEDAGKLTPCFVFDYATTRSRSCQ